MKIITTLLNLLKDIAIAGFIGILTFQLSLKLDLPLFSINWWVFVIVGNGILIEFLDNNFKFWKINSF